MILAVNKIKYNENSINPEHFFDVEVKGNNLENYYVVAFVRGKVIDSNLKIVSNKTRIKLHRDFNKMEKGDTFFVNAYIYDIKKRLIISGRFQEFIVVYSPEGRRRFRPIGKLEGTFAQKFIRVEAEQYVSIYGNLGKTKVHFTVGMFFDGTKNNRFNSEKLYYKTINSNKLLIKKIATSTEIDTEKGKVKVDNASSYWNPYSNVVLLHDLYQTKDLLVDDKDKKSRITIREYVQGIGTLRDMGEDSADGIIGNALGEGKTGVVGKVLDGCNQLAVTISKILGEDKEIGSLTFDVFGFSRGAAVARHFCNEILGSENIEILSKDGDKKFKLGMLGQALKFNKVQDEIFQYDFEKLNKDKVSIRFLGLFDTVLAQMVVKNHYGKKLEWLSLVTKIPSGIGSIIETKLDVIKQRVDNLAIGNIVHLVAKDEWRENFASTRINIENIKKKKEGRVIELLIDGAHSDIGGGYSATKEDIDIIAYVYADNKKGHPIKTPDRLYYLAKWIIDKGYCIDNPKAKIREIQIVKGRTVEYKNLLGEIRQETLFQLKATRTVIPRYSIIPMLVMQELALIFNVPLNNNMKLQKFSWEYDVPKGLEKYKEELIKRAKDIFNGKKPEKQKYFLPKNKYVHLSSNYNVSELIERNGEKISGNKAIDKIFYVNSPHYATDEEISYLREIYIHNK